MTAAPSICPKCATPLTVGVNFCGNCGALISGVWGSRTEMVGKTVTVQVTDSTDTLAELLTRATIGEYDIYGELGRGGMAAVYLALDLALNRKVAIKTMLPDLVVKTDMVERFKREAQTAAGLNHPHIIQIHTVKQTKELVYFVMKFIEGRSLESIVSDQPLSIGTAQVILGQVASALAYAHRKGVVHRDVKPANIMIDEDGWAIVTDFGIAKVQVAQNLTATGTAIGTPTYMSPEQFHNKSITGRSDQYSLGVVAYEVLLGKKPFDGATYAEIITQHLFEPVPDMRSVRPDIPESIAVAVNRMLAKNPDDRFPDLDAAAVALGSPDKAESDRIRENMVAMAKGGPRRTVRMSVPVSPIPITKKPAEAATVAAGQSAATAIVTPETPTAPSPPARRPVTPKQAPVKPKASEPVAGKSRLYMALGAAAVLVVGAIGVWKAMSPVPPPAPASSPTVEQARTPAASSAEVAQTGTKTSAAATEAATSESAASAPASGRVTVSDVPAGAVISLDGRRQSGRDFSARPGEHQLRVQAAGFETMTRRITVTAGEVVTIAFDRRAAATASQPTGAASTKQQPAGGGGGAGGGGLATLQLIVQPPASVILDGRDKGQQSRLAEEVIPGTHTLRIQRDGWVTKDTILTLSAGQTVRLRVQLVERTP